MRNLALADLTSEDLDAMLSENETLFVEHKGGLEYAATKAICSFANTLGGWVLIGVTDGEPNERQDGGWRPVAAAELTDRVREALKTNRVDPIPAFAATVPSFCEEGRRIGVIRVYESDDAPHVMGNGQVFVRSVAQDENRQRVYQAGGVETQAVLVELLGRGRRGISRARARLQKWEGRFALQQLGFLSSGPEFRAPPGGVLLRAAPVTSSRLEDWAVSLAASESLAQAVRGMVQAPAQRDVQSVLHVSGLAAQVASEMTLLGIGDAPTRRPVAHAAADAAGLVGASMTWGNQDPPRVPVRMTLNGFRDQILMPVLTAVCELLAAAELYGRSVVELTIGDLQQHVELDDSGGIKHVPQLPLGQVIALPLEPDRGSLIRLADQWRDDIGRAAGYERYR